MRASTLFSSLLLAVSVRRATAIYYVLKDNFRGSSFLDNFHFETGADPTHGYVRYVDKPTAQAGGLTSVNAQGQVYIGVDYTNVPGGEGRASVRAVSNNVYNHALIVLDLAHMPGGICGTWPAFWTVGPNWPNQGEIDILEGVHEQSQNDMTLHTSDGCSMAMTGQQGTPNGNNCVGNIGCQTRDWRSQSYGTGFNANGGGVYAMEWTSDHIQVWFWPRGSQPANLAGTPDPTTWGLPVANFQGGCNIDAHFQNQQMIFDTTFCGDWAGAVWSQFPSCSSRAPTCESFVQNNPAAFKDAYWLINSLKVYQPGTPPANPPPPATSATTLSTLTTKIATPSAPSIPDGWKSLGCYTDSVNSRTLGYTAAVGSKTLTLENCIASCQAAGYKIAGVEWAQECYCGNSFQNGGGPAPDGSAQCNMACTGNGAETCGGSNRLNVYSLGSSASSSSSSAIATTGPTPTGVLSSYKNWKLYPGASAGCVNEPSTTVRALQYTYTSGDMTVEKCLDHAAGYKYAGIEYGQECWYGNTLNPGTTIASAQSACSSKCLGNSAELCGGGWLLTMYTAA